MQINHLIVHQLFRDSNNRAQHRLSNTCMGVNENSIELVDRLNNLFSGKNYSYSHGVFDNSTINQFPTEFQNYCSNSDLVNFSCRVMSNLVLQVNNTNAKGGYLVFADYNKSNKDYFGVFLLRETTAFKFFQQNGNLSFDIDSIEHIDVDKLAMACQINKQKYQNVDPETRYLRFTKNSKMTDVSQYFYNWLAVNSDRLESSSVYTDNLFSIANSLPLPLKSDGSEMDRDEFKRNIYMYNKSLPSKILDLYELGRQFYPDNETIFIDYADQHDIILDREFKAHPNKMKKFYKVDASADNIHLTFEYKSFNTTIHLEGDSIRIESANLARKIREEMDITE